MKKLFPLILIIAFPWLSQAQFLSSYSDPNGGDCSFNSIIDYGNGEVLAVGTVGSKLLIAECDSLGTIASSHTITLIDESATPICTKAILDANGKVVIVGYRGTIGSVSTYNAFILRYNFSNNSVLWLKEWETIPTLYGALFSNVVLLPNGNYQVSGSFSDPANAQEGLIATVNRTNGNMTIQSLLNYNQSADDFSSFLRFNNKIYTFGRNNLAGADFDKMRPCISILSNSGIELTSSAYVRSYASTARLYGADIKAMGNKIYAAVFGDNSGTGLYKDLYVLRVNATGSLTFTKKIDFDTDLDGKIQTINPTADNKLIVYGNKYDASGAYSLGDAFIVSLTANGNPIYAKSYQFSAPLAGGSAGSMIIDGQNNIWAAGRKYNDVTGHYDGAILRVDAGSGDLENCDADETVSIISETNTAYTIDMQDESTTNSLAQYTTSTASIALTGSSRCANGFGKMAEGLKEQPLMSIYPNPAIGNSTLSYTLMSDASITIDLLDLTGKKVKCLLTKNETSGNHSYTIDVDEIPFGVYLVRMQISNVDVVTSKLIVE